MTKDNSNSASQMFQAALSMPPGKVITATILDRKKFCSLKASLYEVKRKLENTTIKIVTKGNTIFLKEIDENEDSGISFSIEDSSILQENQNDCSENISEQDKITLNSISTLPEKPKSKKEQALLLEQEKEELLSRETNYIKTYSYEKFKELLETDGSEFDLAYRRRKKINSLLFDLRKGGNAPIPRTPTDEKENESELIEPDILDKGILSK